MREFAMSAGLPVRMRREDLDMSTLLIYLLASIEAKENNAHPPFQPISPLFEP